MSVTTNPLVTGIDNAGEKYVRTTRFAIISSGTSGSVTLPPYSTVVADDFGGTTDAVISDVTSSRPTYAQVLNGSGTVVATSFDSSGNYSLTSAPASYPVAIIYRVKQRLNDLDSNSSDIIGGLTYDNTGGGSITGTKTSFGLTVDGQGGVISTGSKGFAVIPFNCSITDWYVIGDQSGSVVIDVKRSGSSIVGAGNKPTLSSAQRANASVSGWTSTTIAANDEIEFNVSSASTLTRVNLIIEVSRS